MKQNESKTMSDKMIVDEKDIAMRVSSVSILVNFFLSLFKLLAGTRDACTYSSDCVNLGKGMDVLVYKSCC